MEKKSHNVKIYTTPTCVWCKKVKEFLNENNVEFKEVDVSTDQEAAQEMTEKSGQTGTPVIDIDGTIIVGFDETAIRKALGL